MFHMVSQTVSLLLLTQTLIVLALLPGEPVPAAAQLRVGLYS